MAENMNDFLKKYYRQLHFNSMPPEVRARFDEWLKAGTVTDEMKVWADDFLVKNARGNFVFTDPQNPKEYKRKNPLNPSKQTDIDDDELAKLFTVFQNALMSMYASRSTFKNTNPQAYEFLETNFSTNNFDYKLFHMPSATDDTVNAIDSILNTPTGLLDKDGKPIPLLESNIIQEYLIENTNKPSGDGKYFESKQDFKKFLGKIKQGKYDTDFKVRDQLCQVAKVLKGATSFYSTIREDSTEYAAIEQFTNQYNQILSDDAFSKNTFNQDQFDRFRKGEAKRLLNELYEYENVFNEFSKHDNGKITKHITKGKNNAKWHDEQDPNYVKPKTNDERTFVQEIQKWADDTYKNCFRKYERLRGDRIFFKNESKAIFKAIDKNEIKPTDGLKALLDKKDDIAKKIDDPLSKQHFEWFTKTMAEISQESPLATAGCWKNSSQMHLVIESLMIKAVRDSKNDIHAIDKAKTAMEIMTTMKYGMLTSKTMDALRKTDLTIFSDKDLSWNKNQGVQFVTNAFDKSIKYAFLCLGYVATFVGNEIRLSNPQISEHSETIKPLVQAEQKRIDDERRRRKRELRMERKQEKQFINDENIKLQDLQAQGYDDASITQKEAKRDIHKRRMEDLQDIYNEYAAKEQFRQDYEDEATQIASKEASLRKQRDELKDLEAKLASEDLGTGRELPQATLIAIAQDIFQQKQMLEQEIDKSEQELDTLRKGHAGKTTAYDDAGTFLTDTAVYKTDYEAHKTKYEDYDSHIKQFHDGKEKIKEAQNAIKEKQKQFKEWNANQQNVWIELEDFWNFMQTGQHIAHTGNTKDRQAQYDKNKLATYAAFKSQRGMTIP